MSEEEKRKLKLNCLTDFQRAGVLCLTGGNYQVFLKHGKNLLVKVGRKDLVLECSKIEKMIKKGVLKKYLADRMLTVGVMASC